jgi:hypothetical protein
VTKSSVGVAFGLLHRGHFWRSQALAARRVAWIARSCPAGAGPSALHGNRRAQRAVPPRFEVKAPDGAPNVVIVLIDDLGFGVPTTFGGPVAMPTWMGWPSKACDTTTFHTTALCSPTRAALKVRAQSPHGEHGLHHRDGHRLPGRPDRSRTPRRRWPRRCGSTATPRPRSASGTRPRPGKRASPVPSTAGRRARASTSSTASWAARRTSGRRSCTTARPSSNCRTTRTTTS